MKRITFSVFLGISPLSNYCSLKFSGFHYSIFWTQIFFPFSGMKDETRLMPSQGDDVIVDNDVTFNFITECLYMTHRCLGLGFHVVNEKFVRLSSELHRMQTLYQEIQQQGAGNLEAGQRVQQRMDRGTSFWKKSLAMIQKKIIFQKNLKITIFFYEKKSEKFEKSRHIIYVVSYCKRWIGCVFSYFLTSFI